VPDRMREAHVVLRLRVLKESFTATGIPSNSPMLSPALGHA
jgi:hypothetical protein